MRVVALSDTHNKHAELVVPDGDLLVHAGDLTAWGTDAELAATLDWLAGLPHRHKLVVAGNHDRAFARNGVASRAAARARGIWYLEGAGVEIRGLRVWGGPWTPPHRRRIWAYELPLAERAREWAAIPADVHVVVTHTPAAGILDLGDRGHRLGCPALRARLRQLPALRAHVCGHLHEGRGELTQDGVRYVNASAFGRRFPDPLRPAIVLDL
ncbi:MAG TPA: metallophosphatase domain-containing protein [Gemmatimonadales bacterium]|jgi:3',5'-cyclic AMP phosphodiesterase CpdA|nr:metallophosphatase domain-containing protein [Gemmatimonadales bacterium]